MRIEGIKLPTHLALVAKRVNLCNSDDLTACFLETSYLAEATIKTIALVLYSGLQNAVKDIAYRYGYELVHADGLGTWEFVIRQASTAPISPYLPSEFAPLLTWLTKRRVKPEDEWFRVVLGNLKPTLTSLDIEFQDSSKSCTVRTLIGYLVQIRNKTRAHGAVGMDFYAITNDPYLEVIKALLSTNPIQKWRWLDLSKRDSGRNRVVELDGLEPWHVSDNEAKSFTIEKQGIHFLPEQSSRPLFCCNLLKSNREFSSFTLPNGGVDANGIAEFIDYASGQTDRVQIVEFTSPPVQLPCSETEGLQSFDIQSNVFGNLPPIPNGYTHRAVLERSLKDRLLDKNHPIITLHGGGGMGKTSLAIYVAHQLSEIPNPPFEHIVWFSARDIDLKPSGPSGVRPSVFDLKSISKRFSKLFSSIHDSIGEDVEALSQVLQSPKGLSGKGILFIFDNFETMTDVRGLHKFLDEHTHLPNKVLLTSRERAFVADYTIEVRGMEHDEAKKMLLTSARELYIEGLMTDSVIQKIYDFTDGHAYMMRVLVGEMAKDGRYVPPSNLVGRRTDIVDAVFERSFNKLSEAGRFVFLIVSNWKTDTSQISLVVVLGVRGIDADSGIDECERLSLIFKNEIPGQEICYTAPQLARVFGQKKLQGDPDRLVIQEDLSTLQKFGQISISPKDLDIQNKMIETMVSSCMAEQKGDSNAIIKADKLLEGLAVVWPDAWINLADFRKKTGSLREGIDYALRRAVEEMPYNKNAWIERAMYAESVGDEGTRISSLVSAVETDPADVVLIRDVAIELCKYVNAHKLEIPTARRGVYLANVRSHMERISRQLDATGLSRLAWLFLLEGNEEKARQYAQVGYNTDPDNSHCIKILENLDSKQNRF